MTHELWADRHADCCAQSDEHVDARKSPCTAGYGTVFTDNTLTESPSIGGPFEALVAALSGDGRSALFRPSPTGVSSFVQE